MQAQDAQILATQELQRRRETSQFWRTVEDLSEVQVAKETPAFWVFFARSQKLIDASHAPGGMFVTVDKHTGRIWTAAEIEAYYAQLAAHPERIAA